MHIPKFDLAHLKVNNQQIITADTSVGRLYRLDDKSGSPWIPSVTTVLSYHKDNTNIEKWRKWLGDEEANRIVAVGKSRGTSFHAACENLLNNTYDVLYHKSLMPDVQELMLQTIPFLGNNIKYILATELAVIDSLKMIAGRTDGVAITTKNEVAVFDFKAFRKGKTIEQLEEMYFLQLSAYASALSSVYSIPISNLILYYIDQESMEMKSLNWKANLPNTEITYGGMVMDFLYNNRETLAKEGYYVY